MVEGKQAAAGARVSSGRFAYWLRRPPLGVLVIGALLLFLGAGLLVGGIYMALFRGSESGWVVWLTAAAVAPLILYVALHVVRLSSWAWLAIIALLILLLASSVVRLLIAPDFPTAAVIEIAAEAMVIFYFSRAHVRHAFRRG